MYSEIHWTTELKNVFLAAVQGPELCVAVDAAEAIADGGAPFSALLLRYSSRIR